MILLSKLSIEKRAKFIDANIVYLSKFTEIIGYSTIEDLKSIKEYIGDLEDINKKLEAALKLIAECRAGQSFIGPLHGAGMAAAFEHTEKIARTALAEQIEDNKR